MNSLEDEKWMRLCLGEAEKAKDGGEIPVGAAIVCDGVLLSLCHNLCEKQGDATAHAECLAISEACRARGSWRLSDCTLYVTLEPCPMCAGAAINARVKKIVYGAKNPRMGACESILSLQSYPLEATPVCLGGVLSEKCHELMRNFFSQKRNS